MSLLHLLSTVLLRDVESLVRVNFQKRNIKCIGRQIRILGGRRYSARRRIRRLNPRPHVRLRTPLRFRSERRLPQCRLAIFRLVVSDELRLKLISFRIRRSAARRNVELLERASCAQGLGRLRLLGRRVRLQSASPNDSQRQYHQHQPLHKRPLFRKCLRQELLRTIVLDHMDRKSNPLQRAIADAILGMTPENLTRHPEGKWSTAEILEHLNLTYIGTVKGLGRCITSGETTASPDRSAKRLQRITVTKLGYFPNGRKSPERVLPRGLPAEQVKAEIL